MRADEYLVEMVESLKKENEALKEKIAGYEKPVSAEEKANKIYEYKAGEDKNYFLYTQDSSEDYYFRNHDFTYKGKEYKCGRQESLDQLVSFSKMSDDELINANEDFVDNYYYDRNLFVISKVYFDLKYKAPVGTIYVSLEGNRIVNDLKDKETYFKTYEEAQKKALEGLRKELACAIKDYKIPGGTEERRD